MPPVYCTVVPAYGTVASLALVGSYQYDDSTAHGPLQVTADSPISAAGSTLVQIYKLNAKTAIFIIHRLIGKLHCLDDRVEVSDSDFLTGQTPSMSALTAHSRTISK